MQTPIIVLLLPIVTATLRHDYYWRDFSSEIPSDAVLGGKDINNHDTYIGQAYIHGHGTFVMQIIPGETTKLAAYGVKKPAEVKRILCSQHLDKFKWMKTTAKTFHLDTIDKTPVVGGYDHVSADKGMLQVGRLMYDGGIVIGSVVGYQLENAQLWFIGKDREQKSNSFEILLFDYNSTNLGFY